MVQNLSTTKERTTETWFDLLETEKKIIQLEVHK